MQLIGTGGAGKNWSYDTADTHATVIAANYFSPMQNDLVLNDRIQLHDGTGFYDLVIATSVKATGAVTVLSSAAYA
jgi:hypothetical protein